MKEDRGTLNSLVSKELSVEQATKVLLDYCKRHDWAGYDPYDALNSRIFSLFPFLRVKAIQWPFTQFMKRSPLNLRHTLFCAAYTQSEGYSLVCFSSSQAA